MKKYLINIFLFFNFSISQEVTIPIVKQPVNDFAKVLTLNEISELNKKVINFYDSSSIQIEIAIFKSLEGEDIRNFAMRYVETNPFGEKEKNRGILFLVAIDDRKISIETGYGMEAILTDALASHIIRNIIKPEFKSQNYFTGLNEGVNAVVQISKGEFKVSKKKKEKINFSSFIFFLAMFFIFPFFFSNRYKINGRGYRRTYFGGPFIGGFGSGNGGGNSGSSWGGSSWSSGGGSFGGGGSSGSW